MTIKATQATLGTTLLPLPPLGRHSLSGLQTTRQRQLLQPLLAALTSGVHRRNLAIGTELSLAGQTMQALLAQLWIKDLKCGLTAHRKCRAICLLMAMLLQQPYMGPLILAPTTCTLVLTFLLM